MKGKKNGKISVRGRTFIGKVVSAKRQKTVKVVWEWKQYIQKYERYARRRSVVHAHVPDDIDVKEGDIVKIGETRPISKTKNFIVLKKLNSINESINDELINEDKNASN
jgi:small subunit ribosomal protein S17